MRVRGQLSSPIRSSPFMESPRAAPPPNTYIRRVPLHFAYAGPKTIIGTNVSAKTITVNDARRCAELRID